MISSVKKIWKKLAVLPEPISEKEKKVAKILETRQHELGLIIKEVNDFQKHHNYAVTMTNEKIRELSIRLVVENNMKWDDVIPEIRKILIMVNKSVKK